MKGFLSPLLVAVLLPFASLAEVKEGPLLLRYNLPADQTNAYAVELAVQGESGKEVMAGKVTVAVHRLGSNLFGLTLRGRLGPRFTPGVMPSFYRPGGPVPLSSLLMGSPVETRELLIDTQGGIVRQAGDQPLPVPLGQFLGSLFPPLPPEAVREWTADETAFVIDDPLLLGPARVFQSSGPYAYMGYYPGRTPPGALAARQKTTLKIISAGPETITLNRTLALDSHLLTGQEPRISASGEGEIVLDRASGWPRKVELQGKSLVTTENVSRRSTQTLRWTLLEGAERDAVLAPRPAQPAEAPVVTGPELDKLLSRLGSPEAGEREAAARELSAARFEELPPRILSALSGFSADSNETVRRAALAVLAAKGDKDQVPLLVKAVNDPDSSTRTAVIKALGRLKDPRAIEPLAHLVASGQPDQFYHPRTDLPATEALIRIGPAAEAAAIDLLNQKHIDTLFQACVILKQIGTKKSLSHLKELTTYPNKELGEAAADACRSIQGRISP